MKKTAVRELAGEEAAWFLRELGGKVPDDGGPLVRAAAARIDGSLRELRAYHRGALSLRYLPRDWPAAIVSEFGEMSSLVVRIECTLHPSVGVPTAALEQASVERLEVAIAARDRACARLRPVDARRRLTAEEKLLSRLESRAHSHVHAALSALAKVRGDEPCVLPGRGES